MAVTYRPGATIIKTIGDAKFHVRQPSCSQSMELAEKLDDLKTGTGPGAIGGFCDLIEGWVVGCDIEGITFTREKFREIVSMPEVMQLLAFLIGGGMTRDDVGK